MLRRIAPGLLLALSAAFAGCAMSQGPDDYNYSAYGGRWQRADPQNGRVGSAFAPAEAMITDAASAEAVPLVGSPIEATTLSDEIGGEADIVDRQWQSQ